MLLAGYLGVPSLLVGQTYLLPTITVVVLGGTSLAGGTGSVAATAVGALFLVQLQQVIVGYRGTHLGPIHHPGSDHLARHGAADRTVATWVCPHVAQPNGAPAFRSGDTKR